MRPLSHRLVRWSAGALLFGQLVFWEDGARAAEPRFPIAETTPVPVPVAPQEAKPPNGSSAPGSSFDSALVPPIPPIVWEHLPVICSVTELGVIGVVESVKGSWVQKPYGKVIESNVVVRIERYVLGEAGDWVEILVPGGRKNGVSLQVGEYPNMRVGQRYLLLLHYTDGGFSKIIGGGHGAVRLDPDAILPPDAALRAIWTEACHAQSSPRVDPALLRGVPGG